MQLLLFLLIVECNFNGMEFFKMKKMSLKITSKEIDIFNEY